MKRQYQFTLDIDQAEKEIKEERKAKKQFDIGYPREKWEDNTDPYFIINDLIINGADPHNIIGLNSSLQNQVIGILESSSRPEKKEMAKRLRDIISSGVSWQEK